MRSSTPVPVSSPAVVFRIMKGTQSQHFFRSCFVAPFGLRVEDVPKHLAAFEPDTELFYASLHYAGPNGPTLGSESGIIDRIVIVGKIGKSIPIKGHSRVCVQIVLAGGAGATRQFLNIRNQGVPLAVPEHRLVFLIPVARLLRSFSKGGLGNIVHMFDAVIPVQAKHSLREMVVLDCAYGYCTVADKKSGLGIVVASSLCFQPRQPPRFLP